MRQAKGGLTFKMFYSTHILPSSQIGMHGDFYILQDAPTVFWKEARWRPWTWDMCVVQGEPLPLPLPLPPPADLPLPARPLMLHLPLPTRRCLRPASR